MQAPFGPGCQLRSSETSFWRRSGKPIHPQGESIGERRSRFHSKSFYTGRCRSPGDRMSGAFFLVRRFSFEGHAVGSVPPPITYSAPVMEAARGEAIRYFLRLSRASDRDAAERVHQTL